MSTHRSPDNCHTDAQLKRMSNTQLIRQQRFIRVAGFTRTDGTVVKSHIRKLSTTEKKIQ